MRLGKRHVVAVLLLLVLALGLYFLPFIDVRGYFPVILRGRVLQSGEPVGGAAITTQPAPGSLSPGYELEDCLLDADFFRFRHEEDGVGAEEAAVCGCGETRPDGTFTIIVAVPLVWTETVLRRGPRVPPLSRFVATVTVEVDGQSPASLPILDGQWLPSDRDDGVFGTYDLGTLVLDEGAE